ncbi:MAG: ECF-type sigma factor [Pseudomonadota bacterium]
MNDPTALLAAWQGGDAEARDALVALLYDQLKSRARSMLAQEAIALQPTELVNEAYMRLIRIDRIDWQNRAHFLALSSRIMRQVLIDLYRNQRSQKRSGGEVTLQTNHLLPADQNLDLEVLDSALNDLAAVEPELSQIVEMKFFGGLSTEEIGSVLDQSESTVKRRWRTARAWLLSELQQGPAPAR